MSDLNTQLALLKTDLGLMHTNAAQEQLLTGFLEVAASEITRSGITLAAENMECNMLVEMYAAWLYRKRVNGEAGMPRMLRMQLNNMLCSQKMRAET